MNHQMYNQQVIANGMPGQAFNMDTLGSQQLYGQYPQQLGMQSVQPHQQQYAQQPQQYMQQPPQYTQQPQQYMQQPPQYTQQPQQYMQQPPLSNNQQFQQYMHQPQTVQTHQQPVQLQTQATMPQQLEQSKPSPEASTPVKYPTEYSVYRDAAEAETASNSVPTTSPDDVPFQMGPNVSSNHTASEHSRLETSWDTIESSAADELAENSGSTGTGGMHRSLLGTNVVMEEDVPNNRPKGEGRSRRGPRKGVSHQDLKEVVDDAKRKIMAQVDGMQAQPRVPVRPAATHRNLRTLAEDNAPAPSVHPQVSPAAAGLVTRRARPLKTTTSPNLRERNVYGKPASPAPVREGQRAMPPSHYAYPPVPDRSPALAMRPRRLTPVDGQTSIKSHRISNLSDDDE